MCRIVVKTRPAHFALIPNPKEQTTEVSTDPLFSARTDVGLGQQGGWGGDTFGTWWQALAEACAARRLGSRGHKGLTGRRGRAPGMRVFVESKRLVRKRALGGGEGGEAGRWGEGKWWWWWCLWW